MSDNDREEWTKTDKGLYLPNSYLANNSLTVADKRKKKGFIKTKFNWVISNLTIILLLPSLIGAIWQILELSSIHISYIRFFSVTQIPIDGALILLPIIISFGLYSIFITMIKDNFNTKIERYTMLPEEVKSKIPKHLKRHIYQSLFFTVILICHVVLTVITLLPNRPIIFILINNLAFFGYVVVLSDTLLIFSIKNDLNNGLSINQIQESSRKIIAKYHEIIGLTLLIGLGILIYLTIFSSKVFSDNYVLPRDLYNAEKITPIIFNDFKTTEYEIMYLNDKYLFIKLCTKKVCSQKVDKEVVIYPTEQVLFD